MWLLIDECVDERLRLLFPGYNCHDSAPASKVNSVTTSTPNTQLATH